MNLVLPLNEDFLFQVLTEDKDLSQYVLDVENSYTNLQDKMILYIANTEINCQWNFDGLDFSLREKILIDYLHLSKIFDIELLSKTIFDIVCFCNDFCVPIEGIFTEDEIRRFVENHRDLCNNITLFMNSTIVYIVKKFHDDGYPVQKFEDIQHVKLSIPNNVVHLYKDERMMNILSVNHSLVYFDDQFDTPVFDGKYLVDYMYCVEGVCGAFVCMLTGEMQQNDKNFANLSN